MSFNKKTVENARVFTGLCDNCGLPATLCFCRSIRPLECPVGVTLVLQWSEYWRVSNTGRLANLALSNSEILLRGDPDGLTLDSHVPRKDETPLFLYPGPGVQPITPEVAHCLAGPVRLYLLDGTWNEANKIFRKTRFLRNMKRMQLPLGLASRYALRRNSRPNGVCTIEAVAHTLGAFGHTAVRDELLSLLSRLVNALSSIRPLVRRREHEISKGGVTNNRATDTNPKVRIENHD